MSGQAIDATLPGVEPVRHVAAQQLAASAQWRAWEIAIWVLAFASLFLLPRQYLLLNEIAILALFALSLDLILGYAGIVSLGHAAFFGLGAYSAGLLSKFGYGDPLLGLAFAGAVAAVLGFATSFLLLRGTDLTRLMVTLGIALLLFELANRMAWLTGGADEQYAEPVEDTTRRWTKWVGGSVELTHELAGPHDRPGDEVREERRGRPRSRAARPACATRRGRCRSRS